MNGQRGHASALIPPIHRQELLAVCFFVVAVIVLAMQASATTLTDRSAYHLGEQIVVRTPPGIVSSMTIESDEVKYRLLDEPQVSQHFTPQQPGSYVVTAWDEDEHVLLQEEFLVRPPPIASEHRIIVEPLRAHVGEPARVSIEPLPIGEVDVTIYAPAGQFRYVGIWEDASFEPKDIGMHEVVFERNGRIVARQSFEVMPVREERIRASKQSYAPGEQVRLALADGVGTEWSLIVTSGAQTVRYFGTERELAFEPLESGQQVLQAVAADGSVLQRITVTAYRAELPVGSTGFLLEDARGTQHLVGSTVMQTRDASELEITQPINAVSRIRVRGAQQGFLQRLRIEDLPPTPVDGQAAVQSYAIDPTTMSFTDATVSAVAKGTELYKCAQYDFTSRTCSSPWVKVRDITPGEEYRFLLTPEDPLYSELNTTFRCSCANSVSANNGVLTCNVFCPFTLNVPGNATSFFLQSLIYNVTITIAQPGGTISNGNHHGFFDHDQTHSNGDENPVNRSTTTTTATVVWTNSSFPTSGARSFTQDDCDNWPNYCTYYVYLNSSINYQAPGGSTRLYSINISLNRLNYTLNYTMPGPFSVVLNTPETNTYTSTNTVLFNYTPTGEYAMANCSLFTDETSWSAKNTSTSITNATPNYLHATFGADGTYLWNVRCTQSVLNNSIFAVLNRTVIIDTTPPVPRQMTPTDGHTETSSSVIAFTYNVSDANPVMNCSLYINGTQVKTESGITRDAEQTINHILGQGTYTWSIGCLDVVGLSNQTGNRTLTVDVMPTIYRGTWYETATANCSTYACIHNLAQQTDGTENTVTGTFTSGTRTNISEATSLYLAGNGAVVNSGSTVTFSSYFQTVSGNNVLIRWFLYAIDESDTRTFICANTAGTATATGATSSNTCTPTSTIRMQATDRLLYVVELHNSHASQSRTWDRRIDHPSTFVNLTNYTQLGTMSASLLSPNATVNILQGDGFMFSCNATCAYGSCLSTQVYAQSNASGTWTNVGASGILTLNGSTNPQSLGTVYNGSAVANISINASSAGTTYLRCFVQSTYANATTSAVQVSVQNNAAPTVTLNAPPNASWRSVTNINFTYTPSTLGTLANCSLYINETFNQTNASNVIVSSQNNFTVLNIGEGSYNWSVTCVDTGLLQGNSSTWYVTIDRTKPSSIDLHEPDDALVSTNPTISFNWTAIDNLAQNMTCRVYINTTVNKTIDTLNNVTTNVTIGVFQIGNYSWHVNCTDRAGNSNTSLTRTFSVQDEAPRVNLVSPGNNTGVNTTAVIFYYNASDNYELASCSLYLGGVFDQTNQTPLVNGINNLTRTLAQGRYNWSMTCTDDAGNNASTGNFTFTVDTTFPAIDLNAPPPDAYAASSTVVFNYTATDNFNNLACTINYDGAPNIASYPTSGIPKTETGTGIADGVLAWDVTCWDLANNTNTSETRNLTINQTPTITQNSPANGAHIRWNVTLHYTPVDNDGFLWCNLSLNGAYSQSNATNITSGAQQNFTLTNPPEAHYNWSAVCEDAGVYANMNQTGNWSFIVDNTPPNIVPHRPAQDEVVNVSTIRFNWTATDNFATALVCDLTINGTVNESDIIVGNGIEANWTVSGFRTGNYTWSVQCVDNATNANTSDTVEFSVLLPPVVNLTYPPDGDWLLENNITFRYLPYEGSGSFPGCSLFLNGEQNRTNTSVVPDVENNISVESLPDGRYNWTVSCTDTNSLVANATPRIVWVDTQAPYEVTLLAPPNDSVVVRNNISFTFRYADALSPNATCTIWLDDGLGYYPLATGLVAQNSTNYTHYELLGDGNYSWNVSCVDLAGNVNNSAESMFEVIAPPNVTLVAPPNDTWNQSGNVTFTYLPDDDFLIVNCTLYLNGAANGTQTGILNKQNNSFVRENLPTGQYNWTVACYDNDNNVFAPPNRTYYVDPVKPSIELNAPSDAGTLLASSVLFNWTADDNLAQTLSCNLVVNGTANQTNMTVNASVPYTTTVPGFTDGLFLWNVTCVDPALNTNTSATRSFTVAEPPRISLLAPEDGTRTRESVVNFTYRPTDNSGAIAGCFVVLGGGANATNQSEVVHGAANNITVEGLTHASYVWSVNCTDPSGNMGTNTTARTLHVDQAGPAIDLLAPPYGETFNTNNITFNWTPTDFNASIVIVCDLLVSNTSGVVNVSGVSGTSGSMFNTTMPNLDDGPHWWNVTCTDDLGNTNTSATWLFIINQPDLYLDGSRIAFNDSNPDLGSTINISANVSNIGGIDASNANVTFWDGDPQLGGAYIGSMMLTVQYNQSRLFSTMWTVTPGFHTIYVSADPLGLINELNETNNNATRDISALKVNITHPPNNTYTNDSTPRIDFNATDYTSGNITYRIFVDGVFNGQAGNVTSGSNTSIDLSALADGVRTVRVQGTDELSRSKNSTPLTLRIDTTAPNVTFVTQNASWYATTEVTVSYNITDALSGNIAYTVFLDGSLYTTNTTTNASVANTTFSGLGEGTHTIIIYTVDEVNNGANSSALTFSVDTTPPVANITTLNNTWFNTSSPTVTFNITDNLAPLLNYTLYVDGQPNVTGTVSNASAGSAIPNGLAEGTHLLILQGVDLAGNAANSTSVRIHIDLTAPNVTLLAPQNDTNLTVTSVTLNFTASDNLAAVLACQLMLDGSVIASYNLTNGSVASYDAVNLASGYHAWNATCLDNASNRGVSVTWRFFIEVPDLAITAGNITLSNSTPIENQTVTVNATVFNIGLLNATNVVVQFWRNDPDGAGATQLGENQTVALLGIGENVTLQQNVSAMIGLNQIFVVVDPPAATNGSIAESNESNNKAYREFWVGLFEVFAGGQDARLHIADSSIVAAFTWNQTNVTGSNIFIADTESAISFTSLVAIARNTTNGTDSSTANDFLEIDQRLNTTALNDSVNNTFTIAGNPAAYTTLTAYRRTIPWVPVINSTNTSAFQTGILWDSNDGGVYYNASQDIVFVTTMNQSQQGGFGVYDYEIAIPAKLRDYSPGGGTVTFYTELR